MTTFAAQIGIFLFTFPMGRLHYLGNSASEIPETESNGTALLPLIRRTYSASRLAEQFLIKLTAGRMRILIHIISSLSYFVAGNWPMLKVIGADTEVVRVIRFVWTENSLIGTGIAGQEASDCAFGYYA